MGVDGQSLRHNYNDYSHGGRQPWSRTPLCTDEWLFLLSVKGCSSCTHYWPVNLGRFVNRYHIATNSPILAIHILSNP